MGFDLAKLAEHCYVADGAWTTALRARGAPTDQPAEIATLEHPRLVVSLAREYLDAGAQFISTNTFAANRVVLTERELEHKLHEINVQGAQLAKNVIADREAYVAGVLGPSGKMLLTHEIKDDKLADAFREQAEALAEGGADVLVLETFSELAELVTAVRAVKSATNLPVFACLSFDSGPNRTRTCMGVEAGECPGPLEEAGADAIGSNCGGGIASALPAVFALRAHTKLPLWVKPSAGLPDWVNGRAVYNQTPDDFGHDIPTLLDAGVNVIGGCCGTEPEHIRRVAALVRAHERRHH